MGPFKFNFDKAKNGEDELGAVLTENTYAWNKASEHDHSQATKNVATPSSLRQVANMIYLDSPAGVGLSYSTKRSDYITGDDETARDADAFLRMFFKQ
jgi:carboxypeptidase C (cathepsin A)